MNATRRAVLGMTLVEMMVALLVFGIVMASALRFLRSQGSMVTLANDRMATVQNLEFALATMEQRLRAAGADVPDAQPALIYAGRNLVAFNADLFSGLDKALDFWRRKVLTATPLGVE